LYSISPLRDGPELDHRSLVVLASVNDVFDAFRKRNQSDH
jgi:hypothetical protein